MKWADIERSKKWETMSAEQRAAAREQFFDEFIAPKAPDHFDVDDLRTRWMDQHARGEAAKQPGAEGPRSRGGDRTPMTPPQRLASYANAAVRRGVPVREVEDRLGQAFDERGYFREGEAPTSVTADQQRAWTEARAAKVDPFADMSVRARNPRGGAPMGYVSSQDEIDEAILTPDEIVAKREAAKIEELRKAAEAEGIRSPLGVAKDSLFGNIGAVADTAGAVARLANKTYRVPFGADISAGAGLLGKLGVESAQDLSDALEAGATPRTQFLEDYARSAGNVGAAMREGQSAERKFAQAELAEAVRQGAGSTAKHAFLNPLDMAEMAGESALLMGTGKLAGTAARNVAGASAEVPGMIASEGAMSVASSSEAARNAIASASAKDLAQFPDYEKLAAKYGADGARTVLAGRAGRDAAFAGAVLQALTLGATRKLSAAEEIMAGRFAATGDRVENTFAAGGMEFLQEAPQGAAETLATNLGEASADSRKDVLAGVGAAGIIEGAAGGIIGGGLGALQEPATPAAKGVKTAEDILKAAGIGRGLVVPPVDGTSDSDLSAMLAANTLRAARDGYAADPDPDRSAAAQRAAEAFGVSVEELNGADSDSGERTGGSVQADRSGAGAVPVSPDSDIGQRGGAVGVAGAELGTAKPVEELTDSAVTRRDARRAETLLRAQSGQTVEQVVPQQPQVEIVQEPDSLRSRRDVARAKADFDTYLGEHGVDMAESDRRSAYDGDRVPQPEGEPVAIGPSRIAGKGVLATAPIVKPVTLFDLSADGPVRTDAGRYVNHSPTPNADVKIVQGRIVAVPNREIQAGQELTINYREIDPMREDLATRQHVPLPTAVPVPDFAKEAAADPDKNPEEFGLPKPLKERRLKRTPADFDENYDDASAEAIDDEVQPEAEVLRSRIADLELELRTNEITGIPNLRAFNDDAKLGFPVVAAIDMDGLRRLNNTIGHEAADVVLRKLATILDLHKNDGARFYHRSGDEFAARFRDPTEAARTMAELQQNLETVVTRLDGAEQSYDYHGIGISYGLGEDYKHADHNANINKAERLASGAREDSRDSNGTSRRVVPAGVQARRTGDDDGGRTAASDVQYSAQADQVSRAQAPATSVDRQSGIPSGLPSRKSLATSKLSTRIAKWLRADFAAEAVALPDDVARALSEFGRIFGRTIQVFRVTEGKLAANGLTLGDNGALYVNEDAASPALTVAAHELLHEIRRSRPDLYKIIAAEVEKRADLGAWRREMDARGLTSGDRKLSDSALLEELTADGFGDAMTDPEFLTSLAERNPSKFRQFAKLALEFFDRILRKMKRIESLGSSEYLTDIKGLRDAYAQMIADYADGVMPSESSAFEAIGDPVPQFSQPANDITATPEFTRWFKDSKVVNNALADMLAKPDGARILIDDLLAAQGASSTRLDPVQALMLALSKNDKIGGAIVGLVPVDVVDSLSKNGGGAKDARGDRAVLIDSLNAPVSDKVLASLRGVLTSLSAKLADAISTGRDVELAPALFASDLNLREVGGLLALHGGADFGRGSSGIESVGAGQAAKSSASSTGLPSVDSKLDAAGFADLLNKFMLLAPHAKNSIADNLPSAAIIAQQGKPLVVYHGTVESFESFSKLKLGMTTGAESAKSAFFFTDHANTAGDYTEIGDGRSARALMQEYERLERIAQRTGKDSDWNRYYDAYQKYEDTVLGDDHSIGNEGANIVPAYLSMRNPLIKDFKGEKYREETYADLIKEAKRASKDGVIFKNTIDPGNPNNEDVVTVYGVFQPTQIKSVNNRGTFDKNDPRILFSQPRTPAQAAADNARKRATVGAAVGAQQPVTFAYSNKFTDNIRGNLRKLREVSQDKMLSALLVQNDIEAARGALSDSVNVYRRENLMHGRSGDQLEQLKRKHVAPLVNAMKAAKVDDAVMEDWLEATFAPERNALIAAKNPAMPDGGSGMTNAEAAAFLAGKTDGYRSGVKLTPEMTKALQSLAPKIAALRTETLTRMVASGEITQDAMDAMQESAPNYVPLRGKDGVEITTGRGVGRGVDVRGKPIKEAHGRGEGNRAENILAELIGDAERSIVQSEKNRVGKTLAKLVLENPNKELWSIEPVQTEQKTDATGQVYLAVKPNAADQDMIRFMHDGKPYHIKIADKRLREAMKGLGVDNSGVVIRFLGAIQRYFSAVLTRYNPNFIPVNALRDLTFGMTAIIAEHGVKIATKAALNYPVAMRAIWRDERGTGKGTAMDRYAREYTAAGGKTFFAKRDSVEEIAGKLSAEFKGYGKLLRSGQVGLAWNKAISNSAMLKIVNDANDAVENAMRLAAYAALRESGKSVEQSAEYAKNITVNFNRKGQVATAANAIILFYNAAMQGAHRSITLLRNPKVMMAMGGLAGLQAVLAAYAMGADDEDEDGLTAWEKIPPWEKERSLIVPVVGVDAKGKRRIRLVKWPMPYGFNVFSYAGGQLAELAMVKKPDPTKFANNMGSAVVNAFSPVKFIEGMDGFKPHIMKIFDALGANEDDLGMPIRASDDFDRFDKPRAFSGRADTPEAYKSVAKALNAVGGGDEVTPPKVFKGLLDWAPEDLEFLTGQLTGGTGRFFADTYKVGEKLFAGVDTTPTDYPILRSLVGEVDQNRATQGIYYDRAEKIEREVERVRRVLYDGRERVGGRYKLDMAAKKKADELLRSTPELDGFKITRLRNGSYLDKSGSVEIKKARGLAKSYKVAQKEIDEIRAEIRAAQARTYPSLKEKLAEIRALQEKREAAQRKFNVSFAKRVQ